MWKLWVLVLSVLTVTSSSHAFHTGSTPICEEGETGYIATLLAENQVFTFLSSIDPPTAESVICQIAPQQLIRVGAVSRGL